MTVEQLEGEIANLTQERQTLINKLNYVGGALEFAHRLLAELLAQKEAPRA